MERSIRASGLESDIVGIESMGSWRENDYYKAVFMREMMDKHKGRDIAWLDADAVIQKYPVEFDNFEADIGMHIIDWSKYDWPRKDTQYVNAVVYLKNNEKTKNFLDRWIEKNENTEHYDQGQEVNFGMVLEEMEGKGEIKLHKFPAAYAQIYDLMVGAGEPVIETFQASRRFKREVSSSSSMLQIEKEEKEKYIKAWRDGTEGQSICATRLAEYVSQFNPEWKMLDLGCGNGITVKMLREKGFDVKGVDITLEAIEKREDFYEAPLWQLPFEDNEFDFTFSTDVLEHLPTDLIDKAIKEIFRVTKIKTFHCIATFMDVRGDVIFHQTVKPIGWWKERFERLNLKGLDLGLMDRNDFLGKQKEG